MKNSIKAIYFIFTSFLLLPCVGFAQQSEQLDTLNIKLVSVAKEIMAAAETCALITLDHQGRPRVRAMDVVLPEDDLTVWFGTNPNSRKVGQIKNDARVTLYYLEKDSSGYVMIHGIAEIVNDQKEKDKRWKAEWEAFYPNKTKDFMLIKVTPEWMEVVSYTHGILGNPITWEPARVVFGSK